MAPAEERRYARRQLRELKDDLDDYERRSLNDPRFDRSPVNDVFNAVRRLIENRVLDLNQFVQADD